MDQTKKLLGAGSGVDDAAHRQSVIDFANALDRIARRKAGCTGPAVGPQVSSLVSAALAASSGGLVGSALGELAVEVDEKREAMLSRVCDPLTPPKVRAKLRAVLVTLAGTDAAEASDILRYAGNAVSMLSVMPKL